jgi:Ca2+/H+ antiporter
VFALVSSADIALTWYPLAFGNAEWEFGTVTASLNGMPLLMIGLALMLGAAVARGQRWLIRTLSAIMVMLAIAVIAVALVYALTLPIALRAVSDAPLAALGLKKAIAKTSIQVMLYPLAFLWLAASGWRHSARQSRI